MNPRESRVEHQNASSGQLRLGFALLLARPDGLGPNTSDLLVELLQSARLTFTDEAPDQHRLLRCR
jgi:hypothetical protein